MLKSLMDMLIPLCKIHIKQHAIPWAANSNVISACRARDKFLRRALRASDPALWQQYHCAHNKANRLLRNAKYTYLSQLASTTPGGSRKFWSNFHYMSRKGSQPSADLNFTPDDLNQYFCLLLINLLVIFPRSSVSHLSFCSVASSTFNLSKISESDVISIIKGLDSKKALGVDGIPVKFIKAEPNSIGILITKLINSSITSGIFPDLWKLAI